MIGDALGIPQGVPANRRALLRKSCTEHLWNVMGPITSAGYLHIPGILSADGEAGPYAMRDEIERIADTTPEDLLADLERTFGGEAPPAWRKVVDNPGDFLISYAGLVRTAWEAVAPVWHRAKPLLEREIERVGAASVTGTMAALLANLSPRTAFLDGRLRLPDRAPLAQDVAVRKLTLLPLVSGTRACVLRVGVDGHASVGYPVAGLAPLLGGGEDRRERVSDALAMTLGELRAVILRKGNQPVSMGKLADLLHCTAGTVTYHCRQLEQAGLLYRERQGREVRILRTLRGDALVDALS
ncbi:MarR family transcriptional regulator [Streptomyces sp. NPDC052496]|uniref:MarR family transcriptional regulator n=1 Tax=Streptomyces sp. NPDC052496 TaxID=3154951 RepID=UPI003435EA5A